MANLKQFRSRELSLWQSAADQVVSKENAGAQALDLGEAPALTRPDLGDPTILQVAGLCEAIEQGHPPPEAPPEIAAATLGIGDFLKFCSTTAFKLAEARVKAILTGNDADVKKYEEELGAQFGECDPRWAQVVAVYVASRVATGGIPYRRHSALSDFVIDDQMPPNANIALVADWGTGQDGAAGLLKKIAARQADVVIHLGDVYYSGTAHEMENYFYKLWQSILGIPPVAWGGKLQAPSLPATFTLCGNHDLYAGGAPYYTVIDMLGQPASYFCLRNQDWQFLAMDTGLHDSDPAAGTATYLEDTEVDWLKDKIANAGGRKTVLLSHHQLFSTHEKIADDRVNHKLLAQLQDVLPQVAMWFWGHEHNLVIYREFQNILARCIGHGAFPVGVNELLPPDPNIPAEAVKLDPDHLGGLLQNGYAMVQLSGPAAEITYWQYDATTDEEALLYREAIPAGARATALRL